MSAGLPPVLAVLLAVLAGPARADTRLDIQRTGLPPLYRALFAAANCPDLMLDQPRFTRTARLYGLTPQDFAQDGPFAPDLATLAPAYWIQLDDDRAAFCSASRLQFAVPPGVLTDNPSHGVRPAY